MTTDTSISERDLALIDAIQASPRAAWTELSDAAETSAVTLARRWDALERSGVAWTGATMGGAIRQGVFAQFRSASKKADGIVSALVDQPEVLTVGRSSGSFTLYAIAVAPTPAALATTIGALADVRGADRVRADPFVEIFGGPRWRAHVLNRQRAGAIATPTSPRARPSGPDPVQREVFRILSADGRRPIADLARHLGIPPATARHQLRLMERRGLIDFRADLARPLAGWPLSGMLRLSVPDARIDEVGASLTSWTEIRFAAHVIADSNLVVIVSLRTPGELASIAAGIRERHPDVRVRDRQLVSRLDKVHGRVLDEHGRSVRMVPIDPWIHDPG